MTPSTWEAFRAGPEGRAHAGASFFVATERRLAVFACWGRLAEDDVSLILPLYDAIAEHNRGTFDLVTDVSAIEHVERSAFDAMSRYVQKHMKDRGRHIRRHALVRPEGVIGAMSAGFYALVAPPYPWRDFIELQDAFAWLERDARPFVAMISSARETVPELRRLREFVAAHVSTATMPAAARALATSERSLHRRLVEHGTSFRAELQRARVAAAQTLLRETDEKLETIARRVGFSSASSFGVIFRRATGMTAGAYRAQRGVQV